MIILNAQYVIYLYLHVVLSLKEPWKYLLYDAVYRLYMLKQIFNQKDFLMYFLIIFLRVTLGHFVSEWKYF